MSDAMPQDGLGCEPLGDLLTELAAALEPLDLLGRAYSWFNARADVDMLNVATLGPPEPSGYICTSGDLGSEEEITRVWDELVEASASVRPDLGAHPRRRGDRRLWGASEELMTPGEPRTPIGRWVTSMGGGPSVLVMPMRRSEEPLSPECDALCAKAAQYVALYLRGVDGLCLRPQTEPGDDSPFEGQLEYEVERAQRQRTAVSLALIEYRLSGAASRTDDIPDGVHERITLILERTTRGNDRVCAIGETCVAVIMPKTDARGALVGADRLQRTLQSELVGSEPELSVRIGIGGRDPAETGASELFARASQALAQARSSHGEAAFLYV